MKKIIADNKEYHATMVAIYEMMNKGEANLTDDEIEQITTMSKAAERYEDEVLKLKPVREPQTISEAVELFMFENKMSQAKLADKLGIAKSKLSQILTGKRSPDVPFLKSIYHHLKIDPRFILEHV